MTQQTKTTTQDFTSTIKPTWCPGCGNFAILQAIKMAFVAMNLSPTDVVLCFDIGCNSNMADKINAYVFKGLHGRVLPIAAGISLANKNIPVIAFGGDGATFDEGMQHFIHTFRSNYNFTFILHNNCDFGLTTGQATPTTPKGQKMNSSPFGVVEDRLNSLQLALSLCPSFVARGFSGNIQQLTELIKKSIEHDGFSYLEVLQSCPTYNEFFDLKYYQDRIYDIATDTNYDPQNLEQAYKLADYTNERIATGVLYQNKESLNYLKRTEHLKNLATPFLEMVEKKDVSEILGEFK